MGIRLALLVIVSLSMPSLAFAKRAPTPVHACRIIIKQVFSNGERRDIIFDSKLNSKQECVALAKIHMPNFDPGTVSQKQVLYHWYR